MGREMRFGGEVWDQVGEGAVRQTRSLVSGTAAKWRLRDRIVTHYLVALAPTGRAGFMLAGNCAIQESVELKD